MKTVADIMTDVPIVVEVPGTRSDAINVMVRNKLTGVPVVRSSDGNLVGMVSRKDVLIDFNEEQLSLIMKKNIITVSPDATISDAAKIFTEKKIHRLPVVDKGKLIGIITPTDLLDEVKSRKTELKAEDVITTTCVTAYIEDPLSYIVAAMRISKIIAFPVVDAKGKLAGIITDRDLFIDQIMSTENLDEIGIKKSSESLAEYRNVLPLFYVVTEKDIPEEYVVKDYMVKDPVTVFKKTPISDIARIMKQNDFAQIPVHGNNNELIGMVYDVDVLLALND